MKTQKLPLDGVTDLLVCLVAVVSVEGQLTLAYHHCNDEILNIILKSTCNLILVQQWNLYSRDNKTHACLHQLTPTLGTEGSVP